MVAGAKDTPGFAFAPHVVTVAGGIPIFSADGRTLLGAAGASGEAPQDDAVCGRRGSRRWAALQPSLSKGRAASIGAPCRKSIPMPVPRSKGCCSMA